MKKRSIFFVVLFQFITMVTTATAISIPGTGRGVALNAPDQYWWVEGEWLYDVNDPDYLFSGRPERKGTTAACLANGDYHVEFFEERPAEVHGAAEVYFYYEFYVVQAGAYSISCQVSGGNSAEIAAYVGSGQPNIVGSFEAVEVQTLSGGNCENVNITANLAVGRHAFRIKKMMTTTPVQILVSSSGSGSSSNCVPVVEMNSDDSQTIASGATTNINFSSSVESTYNWTTAGNPNTSVSAGSQTNASGLNVTITNNTGQTQTIVYIVTPTSSIGNCIGIPQTVTIYVLAACVSGCDPIACTDCIGSFKPDIGATYVISAWVQLANSATEMTYDGPSLAVSFTGIGSLGPFHPTGPIIDGWQRIEDTFTVPPGATEVSVKLVNNASHEAYFDDLRIHPLKASMKSFVYDPVSMRLMAELDENNYATFYEYNEEGALIRVKKETERGVKTIKETGNNTRKQ